MWQGRVTAVSPHSPVKPPGMSIRTKGLIFRKSRLPGKSRPGKLPPPRCFRRWDTAGAFSVSSEEKKIWAICLKVSEIEIIPPLHPACPHGNYAIDLGIVPVGFPAP